MEFVHFSLKLGVGFHKVFNGTTGMYDGAMVAVAEMLADYFEGTAGIMLGKVHGYLPGLHHIAFSGFAFECVNGNIKVLAHHFLNQIDCYFAAKCP